MDVWSDVDNWRCGGLTLWLIIQSLRMLNLNSNDRVGSSQIATKVVICSLFMVKLAQTMDTAVAHRVSEQLRLPSR